MNLLTQSVTMYINMTQFNIKRSFESRKNSNRLSIVAFNVCKWCLKSNSFKKAISSHFDISSHEYCKQFCFNWADYDCFLLTCFSVNHVIKKLKAVFLRVITRFQVICKWCIWWFEEDAITVDCLSVEDNLIIFDVN